MQVRSTYRFARISAFKAREVTREIQGLPASDALDLLRFTPKKAAGLVRKTLASAVANAENNNNLNVSNLVIQQAVVGKVLTLSAFSRKRAAARDRSASAPVTSASFSLTKSRSSDAKRAAKRKRRNLPLPKNAKTSRKPERLTSAPTPTPPKGDSKQ